MSIARDIDIVFISAGRDGTDGRDGIPGVNGIPGRHGSPGKCMPWLMGDL